MDDTTLAVRTMYEQYPYPPGTATLRSGSSAHMLLSYGQLAPPRRRLVALDAGCGRGVGTLGHAATQPDIDVVGVDINRTGLREAEAQAKHRGLVNLRFQEVDLMTLDGLTVPPGGFDIIYSSGVIHHLTDPVHGLRALGQVLAPHGMVQLMVYGRVARDALYRMARSVDLVVPRDRPFETRLAVGRDIARAVHRNSQAAGIWPDAATVPDVEFVDRYLHVRETSYDVESLFGLIESAGLRFVRWSEPEQWSIAHVLAGLGAATAELSPRRQFQVIEQLCDRPRLELVLCRPPNQALAPVSTERLAKSLLAVNPEASFAYEKRNLRGQQRLERITIKLRSYPPFEVPNGPVATVLLLLADQTAPFPAQQLLEAMAAQGITSDSALATLVELVKLELLYRLHDTQDLAA